MTTPALPLDPFLPIKEIGLDPEKHEGMRRAVLYELGRDIGPCPSPVLVLADNPTAPQAPEKCTLCQKRAAAYPNGLPLCNYHDNLGSWENS